MDFEKHPNLLNLLHNKNKMESKVYLPCPHTSYPY
jgi:hypothetical protein